MKKKTILFLVVAMLFLTNCMAITNANLIKTKMDNNPPNPPVIEGPTSGEIKETYTYNITVTDPDPEDYLLKLEVDFGDGIVEETCGCDRPWENGQTIKIRHRWTKKGTYEIKARVTDVYNYWSEWSEPIVVTMPKEKINPKITNIFQQIFENLPNIYNIFVNTRF